MKKVVCKRCGRKLSNKNSIAKEYGPVCEQKQIQEFYQKRQITFDEILDRNRERRCNNEK